MQIVKSDRLHFLFIFLSLLSVPCKAQEQPSQPLKLESAVRLALSNYPAIRAAQAQRQAAEAGVELARTNYLPRADMFWQQNRATRNNVFGLLLPQAVIPPISGPQLDSTSLESAWGSAGGLMLSWEPFDFGLRKANVDLARAIGRQANANEAVTRLDVSAAAADAFLTLLATEQTMEAAQAGVERAETLARAVRALVENQLRPGVDASRADAELAAAKNRLIQAEQNTELARANLAETIGQGEANITIDPGPLLELPPAPPPPEVNLTLHPLAIAQTAAIGTSRSRERLLDRSWFPRFNWQTAVFGRGTGARLDGTFENGNGWRPNTFNWATGMTISFPVFDVFGLRSRRKEDVQSIPVNTANGAHALASDVAEISYGTAVGQYDRYNQQRMVTIIGNISGEDLGAAAREVNAAISRAGEAPRGVTVNVRGQVPPMRQTQAGLQLGLLLAVAVIFLLLTASFQSLRVALVILSMIPAVIAGVVVALWVTGTTLNVQSFMGAIMAIGVSVANAILLVTFAEQRRREGQESYAAAMVAASSRLRPILMTSFAMIAGMIPMAMGIGEGSEQTAPLGRAVIGGLGASTIAVLLVLPLVFSIAQRKASRVSASLHPEDLDS